MSEYENLQQSAEYRAFIVAHLDYLSEVESGKGVDELMAAGTLFDYFLAEAWHDQNTPEDSETTEQICSSSTQPQGWSA